MVASRNRSRTLPQTAVARGVAERAATPFSIQPGCNSQSPSMNWTSSTSRLRSSRRRRRWLSLRPMTTMQTLGVKSSSLPRLGSAAQGANSIWRSWVPPSGASIGPWAPPGFVEREHELVHGADDDGIGEGPEESEEPRFEVARARQDQRWRRATQGETQSRACPRACACRNVVDLDAREMHRTGLGGGRGRRVDLDSGGRKRRCKETHVLVPSPWR